MCFKSQYRAFKEAAKERQGTRTDLVDNISDSSHECKEGQARDQAGSKFGANPHLQDHGPEGVGQVRDQAAKERQATSTGGTNPHLQDHGPEGEKGQVRDHH